MIKHVILIALAIMLSGCMTCVNKIDAIETGARCNHEISGRRILYSFRRTTRSSGADFSLEHCQDVLSDAWAPVQEEAVALSQFRKVFSGNELVEKSALPLTGMAGFDIRMTIVQQNSYNSKALVMASIPGLFLLVPSWWDSVYSLYVEAEKADGTKRTYLLSSKMTIIVGLPFALALPFTGTPESHVDELTFGNWQALKHRMENDGF